MQELESQGKETLAEKIILVASPQMGTPTAILSMLHGYDETVPTLVSASEARTLAEHMPGAYGLLPSRAYWDRLEGDMIVFSSENSWESLHNAYGEEIDSYEEYISFLTGEGDDREEPENDAIESINVLRIPFFEEAETLHNQIDNWEPPSSVEVIQIAGWGIDTVSGLRYSEKEKTKCERHFPYIIPQCEGIR